MGNGGWIGRGSGVLALLFINLPEAIFVKKKSMEELCNIKIEKLKE